MTVVAFNEAAVRRFRELWSAAALQLIREAGSDTSWMSVPDAAAASGATSAWAIRIEVAPESVGRMDLCWSEAAALAWAKLVPPAAGADAADSNVAPAALERLLALAQEKMRAAGWDAVTAAIVPGAAVDAAAHAMTLAFVNGAGDTLELPFRLDAALCDAMRALPPAHHEAARLDMLRDVELDVSLRFGGRQVLLSEVVELSPGSVVELDRAIDGPVELLVGGKVIAWGEVVVVDGNYGLRVTRLLQPMDRMAAVGGAR